MRSLVAAAVAVSGAALAWFVRAKTTPPSFDEAWYLEVSFRFWNALADRGPLAFAREWAAAFRFKAPLVSALPIPFFAVLGPSYDAAVLANLPALAILAASVYRLGRHYFSPAAGAAAACLSLFMPLTSALSRTFFVETWLTALVAAFLCLWVDSEALRKEEKAPMLGGLLGLGFLCKVLFPLPLIGPVMLTLLERRAPMRQLERPLKVLAAAAAALALTWYGPNLLYITGYIYKASFGDIAVHYGPRNSLSALEVLRYWNAFARDGTSYFVAVPLALLLLRRGSWSSRGIQFALAWGIPPLLVSSLGVGKDLRFTAPALPAFALALAGAIDLAAKGRLWILALAVALPFDLFLLQTFGRSVLPVGPSRTAYGGAPQDEGRWGQDGLVRDVASRIPAGSVVVLGCEHAYLNANILSAWAELQRTRISFIHYGHMEERVARTMARFAEKDATHMLFVDGLPENELPPMVPKVDAALRALIARGALPFRDIGPVPIGGGLKAELWERTGPIRMVGIIPP